MILTTMLLMIATLAVVVIGFILDRLAIRKIKSGMRTLNTRIKRLERVKFTVEDCYVEMDSETETPDGGDISAETDDTVQETGD